jgi:hypothetical protein
MQSSEIDLSTLQIVEIIASVVDDYQLFINEAVDCGFRPGSIFKGWQGIASKFPVIMIYLATEHNKGETFKPRSFTKKTAGEVYQKIYEHYTLVCRKAGLRFVPGWKGLETTIKKLREC